MCLSPIRLPNKFNYARTFDTVVGQVTLQPSGRHFIYVPCGHCEQCLQQKRDSLYIRVRNEYIYNGRRAVFQTLTYAPSNRPTALFNIPPYITYYDFETTERVNPDKPFPTYKVVSRDTLVIDEGFSTPISCWDKKHIQDYLKTLNDKILYDLGKSKGLTRLHHGKLSSEWLAFLRSTPRPLKYIVTCERGSADIYYSDSGRVRFGQQCPHYHIILLPQLPETDLPLDYLKDLSVNLWKYGRSYPLVVKKSTGYSRSPYKAIQYVCKYVTKSDCFDYELRFTHNGKPALKFVKPSMLTYSSHAEELRKKPFVLLSHGVGLDWLLSTCTDYIIDNILKNGIRDTGSNGKPRNINLPSYYLNKLRYDIVKKSTLTCYEPNNNTRKLHSNLDSTTSFCKYNEIWDNSTSTPSFICFEPVIPSTSLSVSIPSSLSDRISRQLYHLKATYFADTLDFLKQEPDYISLTSAFNNSNLSKLCPSLDYLVNLISATSSDDLYCHVVNDLYTGVNQELDTLVDCLMRINSYYKGKSIKLHDITYKANLFKSVSLTPELFNVYPLCTNSI